MATRSDVNDLYALALRAYRARRPDEARTRLDRLLAIDPRCDAALHLLGVIAYDARRYDDAVALLRRSYEADRKSPERLTAFGMALLAAGECAEAASIFRRAVALRPADAGAHNRLGEALRREGRGAEAETSLRRAIGLDASCAAAYRNLAVLLADTGREAEAADCLERAIELEPGQAEAIANLGAALHALGRVQPAIDAFRRAIVLAPDNASFHLHLAYALLGTGRLEEGWSEYEWRFGEATGIPKRPFAMPPWRGEPLEGRSLLVWMEQGIGDELEFAGFLPGVVARARRCTVECAPKLAGLFRRSFPGATIIARGELPDAGLDPAPDFQVAAGSVARWLGAGAEFGATRGPYLRADPARVEHWRSLLGARGPALNVGFTWRSSNLSGARALACTRLEQWGPILAVPGARFVCLQYDECAAELALARKRFGVEVSAFPEIDLYNDLEEAAALTAAMDLVITAPTAACILAAALGVETWVMSYGPDWKTLGTERTPWQPALRRYDRVSGQPWEEIVGRVASDLSARIFGRAE